CGSFVIVTTTARWRHRGSAATSSDSASQTERARSEGVGEALDVADRRLIHVGERVAEDAVAGMTCAVDRSTDRAHAGVDEHAVEGESFVAQRVELVHRDDVRGQAVE